MVVLVEKFEIENTLTQLSNTYIKNWLFLDYNNGSYVNEITEYDTKGETEPNGKGPNKLTTNQEVLVRSAIKYWVERHKHIVKYGCLPGDDVC